MADESDISDFLGDSDSENENYEDIQIENDEPETGVTSSPDTGDTDVEVEDDQDVEIEKYEDLQIEDDRDIEIEDDQDVETQNYDDIQIEDNNDIEIESDAESLVDDDPLDGEQQTALEALSAPNQVLAAEVLIAFNDDSNTKSRKNFPSAESENQKTLAYDEGNLSAYDPADVDIDEIFKHKKPFADPKCGKEKPRRLTQSEWEIRNLKEKALYKLTRSNMQALSNRLFSLKTVNLDPNEDPGIVVTLPKGRFKLPRSKPVEYRVIEGDAEGLWSS